MAAPAQQPGTEIDATAASDTAAPIAGAVRSESDSDCNSGASCEPRLAVATPVARPGEDAIVPPSSDGLEAAPVDIVAGRNSADAVDPFAVNEDDDALGLSRGDALICGVLAAALLVLSGIHWAQLTGWGGRVVEIDRAAERSFETRLDLNTSTWVELAELDSVGEVLARRIVEYREQNGPFATVDVLRKVPGVGAKTLEKIAPWVKVEPASPAGP